jgi:hypothetical protein
MQRRSPLNALSAGFAWAAACEAAPTINKAAVATKTIFI